MFDLKSTIQFAQRNRLLTLLLVVTNLAIISYFVPGALKKHYRSNVKIAFNKVDHSFENNMAADHLFKFSKGSPHSEFLGLLQSDSLMEFVVQRMQLADHYNLPPDMENRSLAAQKRLRNSLDFLTPNPILIVKLTDKDRDVAESALLMLVDQVDEMNGQRIANNNAITKQAAQIQIDTINAELDALTAQLNTLFAKPRTPIITSQAEMLQSIYRQKLNRKYELEDIVQQVLIDQQAPRYQSYSVINSGVQEISNSLWVVLVMAMIGFLVSLMIELHIASIFTQIRRTLRSESTAEPRLEPVRNDIKQSSEVLMN